ncbi:MAG: HEPN domain-containing protein [Candidatus Jordarchaeaceae archaeon]
MWILMAISDLERVIRNFESEDFAAAVFRAQTSAERLSKGLIFLFGLQFKKTHKPQQLSKMF